jgi:hypothetical protein
MLGRKPDFAKPTEARSTMGAPRSKLTMVLMTIVLAITQSVLLTLGTIFLKGMVHANGDSRSLSYFQFLDNNCEQRP